MRVPYLIREPIAYLLYRFVACRRPADQYIGEGPYMLRWWLFGTSKEKDDNGEPKPRRPFGLSFYLHIFLRSDDDRALHDHPWDFWSILLVNGYREHRDEDAIYLLSPEYHDQRGGKVIAVHDTRRYADDPVRVIREYEEGSVIASKATDLHRVQLHPRVGIAGWRFGRSPSRLTDLPWMTDRQAYRTFEMWRKETPVMTLFFAGLWQRKWGFMCEDGWKHWRDFDADGGCGEKSDEPLSL
jgi:hypothetical protein